MEEVEEVVEGWYYYGGEWVEDDSVGYVLSFQPTIEH